MVPLMQVFACQILCGGCVTSVDTHSIVSSVTVDTELEDRRSKSCKADQQRGSGLSEYDFCGACYQFCASVAYV